MLEVEENESKKEDCCFLWKEEPDLLERLRGMKLTEGGVIPVIKSIDRLNKQTIKKKIISRFVIMRELNKEEKRTEEIDYWCTGNSVAMEDLGHRIDCCLNDYETTERRYRNWPRVSDHLHRGVHRRNKQDLLDFPRHLSETNGLCRVRILRRVSSSHDLNEMLRDVKIGF